MIRDNLSEIALIVPTFNMAEHLPILWQSLEDGGVVDLVSEIIFVNDGSTDSTSQVIQSLACPKVHEVSLEKNQGRFNARFVGVREAKSPLILFLDTRLTLGENFSRNLKREIQSHSSLMGCVDIDINRSVFCLYWQRSHERIFSKHYRDTKVPLLLTPENYDQYLKGTGVFLCRREHFLKLCERFSEVDLLSDDTFLLREYVKLEPILIHPELRIWWRPRESGWSFLKRLWDRGPGFAEYHVFERQGLFFWAILILILSLSGWIGLLFYNPELARGIAISAFLVALLSSWGFAKNFLEGLKMAPLHLGVLLAFGGGAIWGILVGMFRIFKRSVFLQKRVIS